MNIQQLYNGGTTGQWAKAPVAPRLLFSFWATYAAASQFELWGAPADATGCAPDLTKEAKVKNFACDCNMTTNGTPTDFVVSFSADATAPTATQFDADKNSNIELPIMNHCYDNVYYNVRPVGGAVTGVTVHLVEGY